MEAVAREGRFWVAAEVLRRRASARIRVEHVDTWARPESLAGGQHVAAALGTQSQIRSPSRLGHGGRLGE